MCSDFISVISSSTIWFLKKVNDFCSFIILWYKILGVTLLKYLRHVSLYKLLRDSNEYNIWPHDFGEPYPDNLKYLIEKKTFELQREYNTMTNDYKID